MTKVSWKWGGKTYTGTLIPSMEDKENKYARTENGKIKKLPKKQTKKDRLDEAEGKKKEKKETKKMKSGY